MAAEQITTAKPDSLAEIARAADSWGRTAKFAEVAYDETAKYVAAHMPASLIAAGLDADAAHDMAQEMWSNLASMSGRFAELAEIAKDVQRARADILEMVAKAKRSTNTDRRFTVVA